MSAQPATATPLPDDLARLRADNLALRDRVAELEGLNEFLQQVNDSLNEGNITLTESLVLALDARDAYTAGHSLAVAVYSRDIAIEIGMPECSVHRIYLAGLVHDIGKIAVSDAVLLKPGKLTAQEFDEIKKHPVVGAEILAPAQGFDDILGAVRHHHERIDGGGYPDGLKGDSIPLVARILAVSDAYNAMTSARPYRQAMPVAKARSILEEHKGRQHDVKLVDAFARVLDAHDDQYAVAKGPEFLGQQALLDVLARYTVPTECMRLVA